jgi:uncharacterized SAM-dependent methyltransferase
MCKQQVKINGHTFHFTEGEPIHTEISQKYTIEQTNFMAKESGFTPIKHLVDARGWFLDAVWQCV